MQAWVSGRVGTKRVRSLEGKVRCLLERDGVDLIDRVWKRVNMWQRVIRVGLPDDAKLLLMNRDCSLVSMSLRFIVATMIAHSHLSS